MKELYTLTITDVGLIKAAFIICDNFYIYLWLSICS